MLTYELKKEPGKPLYESLYRCIREDILAGRLAPGEKLPSKRALSQHLEISKVTVESAYNQLLAEGYLSSREKVGYFVEKNVCHHAISSPQTVPSREPLSYPVDLLSNAATGFPFSVWMKLQRQVMLDYGDRLLAPLPTQGYPELRGAIAAHLAAFRSLQVDPENIIIGAGTDFLYNLLIQLLGRDRGYALEDPGYGKIRLVYEAAGARCLAVPMDAQGVRPDGLEGADVLHCSPSHHFPTGIVTPTQRRQQLLDWAGTERYIIEDDYDSEFRFHARPIPALMAMDRRERVIYINTFSKTLAPSIRLSYMVLPRHLMDRFRETLGFYSCTVASFEQHTLARFLSEGYFEKHINRMRKFYRNRRNRIISLLENSPFASRISILEQDAGLHFLVKADTGLSGEALVNLCAKAGIRISSLDAYYTGSVPEWAEHCLVVNYSGVDEHALPQALQRLAALPAD